MKLLAGVMLFAILSLVLSGCATKKYVRNQTEPVISRVNELDDLTAKNTRDIRDTDARAQQGIQQVNTKTNEAVQKAQAAGQQADRAQLAANTASNGINALSNAVVNLDNYKPVTEAAVHFGFNQSVLTAKSKEALDELGGQIVSARHYIVVVDGNTDSVGSAEYNYVLSQRRADAVIHYLATKYNVPAHKIYVIGLGKDKPAAPNQTAKGRAENRRVEVRLMTNMDETSPSAQAQPASMAQR